MVAHAASTPLPTLSPADKLRLNLYFATGQSTEALAHQLLQIHHQHHSHLTTNTPPSPYAEALTTENTALASFFPTKDSGLRTQDSSSNSALSTQSSALLPDSFDLAAWTLSDSIAPHIAYRRAEVERRRKDHALEQLEAVLNTSDSPIERRRAATTLLRMLSTQLPRAARTPESPRPPSPRPRVSDSPSPVHPFTSSPVPISASPLHPSTPSPTQSPNPTLQQDAPAAALFRALQSPHNPIPLAAAQSFLSPNATINGTPITNVPEALQAIAPTQETIEISIDDVTDSSGPPETFSFTATFHHDPEAADANHPPLTSYQITLTRDSNSHPHPNCWLIARIDPIHDSS